MIKQELGRNVLEAVFLSCCCSTVAADSHNQLFASSVVERKLIDGINLESGRGKGHYRCFLFYSDIRIALGRQKG